MIPTNPYREEEITLTCPYCWQTITMLVDTSLRSQSYIEDCEVCCNPIEVHVTIHRGAVAAASARRAQ